MKVQQSRFTQADGWVPRTADLAGVQCVLVFGARDVLDVPERFDNLRRRYPHAHILGCTTAGEIAGATVLDESIVATAMRFEHTEVRAAQMHLPDAESSGLVGERLGAALDPEGLVHVVVVSEGLHVNGSALVAGLARRLPAHVAVTGGLSADGVGFERTLVMLDGPAASHRVAVVGFYGGRLKVGYGSLGGWDPFGPERLITRSKGNILFEIDGMSALGLYKQYLGEHGAGLPASGLLFPLSLRTKDGETGVVRTILGIDEAAQSLIFAGDVPEGSYGRLMRTDCERLIEGATGAAKTSLQARGARSPDLAILISCVGRKLVLEERVGQELESVREVLGDAVLAGFYSYGEICPFLPHTGSALHNQTMTITTFSEG